MIIKSKLYIGIKCITMLCTVFCIRYSFCQQPHSFCGQHIVTQHWLKSHPQSENIFHEHVSNISKKGTGNTLQKRNRKSYTVPVVFHILHQGGPENISDLQIHDQVRILNRDYHKLNADTASVIPSFKNNIAHVNFTFKLAQLDPDGACTNGIVRHYTGLTNWDAYNLNDFIFSWPTDKYLNVYVVRNINIAPAYTFLPGVGIPKNADVIVIAHNILGSIGTATVANSRALTHEVGHWFGLPHIWGIDNLPGITCGNDFVDDTPITKGFTSCPPPKADICNPGIEENYQNYMDYSPCKFMFTNGQADYMHNTIESGINNRIQLVSEENLLETGVIDDLPCITKADFYSNAERTCAGEKVNLYSLCKFGKQKGSLRWAIEGGNPASSTDSVVEVLFLNAGKFEITLYAITNGDTQTVSKFIEVTESIGTNQTPDSINFEQSLLPQNISTSNIQNDIAYWQHYLSGGARQTNRCIYLNNADQLQGAGLTDIFETGNYNFTNLSRINFSFYYAYAKFNTNQNDVFKLEYSLDCGATWKALNGVPTSNSMAIGSGGTSTIPFFPTESQWKQVNIPGGFLAILRNKPSVKFRFIFKSDPTILGSNNLFIDEINISGEQPSAAQTFLEDSRITIFPNPSFTINTLLHFNDNADWNKIIITNSHHQILMEINSKDQLNKNTISLAEKTTLPSGLYIAHIIWNGSSRSIKKFIIME